MSTWCIKLIGTDGREKCVALSSFSLGGQTWGVVITNLARQDEPVGRWIHRDCLLFWQVSVPVNLSGNYRINAAIFTWKYDWSRGIYTISHFLLRRWFEKPTPQSTHRLCSRQQVPVCNIRNNNYELFPSSHNKISSRCAWTKYSTPSPVFIRLTNRIWRFLNVYYHINGK